PFEALVEGNVLAIMFLAIVFGLALTYMINSSDEHTQNLGLFLRRGVDGGVELVSRIIKGVLEYAPVGVFALLALVLAETGAEALVPLLNLPGVVSGEIIDMFVVCTVLTLVFRVRTTLY